MRTKIKLILFLFITLAFVSLQNDIAFAGFGVSPSSIVNKDLIPGSSYTKDIYLVQGNPDVDMNVNVTLNAGNINSWINIENGNRFVIPKGTQQYLMKVGINVPKDIALGEYKGTITINTSPVGSQKDGVSIVLGTNIGLDLTVSSIKVSNFSVQNFKILDSVVGSPLSTVIKVKNDGNVENGPTKIDLTFFDQYHSKQLGKQEKFITEKVKSFETRDLLVEFPNQFEVGSYWADVKIYSDDKTIVDSKVVFAVVSGLPVEKTNNSGFSMPDLSMIPVSTYLLVAIIILLIVVVIVLAVKKRDNKIS